MTQSFICYTYDAEVTLKVTNLMVSLSEDSTFEEFTDGPSPNSNCPQEIETVGSNINLCNGINQGYYLNFETYLCGLLSGNNGLIIPTTGGKYTISTQINQTRYRVACINEKPIEGKTVTAYKGVTKDGTSNNITIDTSGYAYLIINATDLTKIKIEKGTKATPYSPYGQGSVEVIKRNRNQFDIAEQTRVNNGTTSNYKDGTFSLVGTATMNWTLLTQSKTPFYLKAGEYTVSVYDFNVEENYSLEFTLYHADNTSTKMYLDKYNKHRTYTVEKDVTGLTVGLSGFKAGDTLDLEFSVQLEEGKTSKNWILPRSEEFIVPIQREMLEGDYIDGTEHHTWGKLILTGTEPWYCETNGRFGYLVQNLPKAYKKTIQTSDLLGNVCNSYIEKTPAQTWKGTQGFCIDPGGSLRIWDDSYSKTSDLAGFKAMLAEKYNAGNPVVCYLKLATPIELELTDEQKAISKYLQPYDNGTTILVTDKLATITASYTKKGENDEN